MCVHFYPAVSDGAQQRAAAGEAWSERCSACYGVKPRAVYMHLYSFVFVSISISISI